MATFLGLYEDALHTELGTNDTAVLFTGARRKHAINEGYRQFADLTECFTKQSTLAVSTGVQELDLSTISDYVRVAAQAPAFIISDSNGQQTVIAGDDFRQRDIPYLDAAESGWRSTETGYPSGWYLRNDGGHQYFGLDRRFDLSSGSTLSAKLVFPYVAIPSSMTSDTQVPFAVSTSQRTDLQPYHQALVHYAAHQLEKLRKDQEASDRQLKAFLGYVERFLGAMRPKGPRSARTAVPYFRNARRGGRDRGGLLAPWWYR